MKSQPSLRFLLSLLSLMSLPSCTPPSTPASDQKAQEIPTLRFEDATQAAGLTFQHQNGASPRRYLPETLGSGVACFDADGDGHTDLFFVGGNPNQGGALYQNLGDGRFREVAAGSGLEQGFWGMGAAVGDIDGDGDLDLFVSGVGSEGQRGDHLFRNDGGFHFSDVSAAWGLDPQGFGSSAAFFDLENDGDLDLFVGRYVAWSPAADRECRPNGVDRSYCTPEAYPSVPSKLYRNDGGKSFTDISAASGLAAHPAKALGVVPFDVDGDGLTDLAVASDTTANLLFHNRGDGRFEEIGAASGIALSASGAPRGAMGIDAGDLDGDLADDLLIGNFAQEMSALYLQSRPGLFVDEATRLGFGVPTLMHLAFGTLIADFDNDGYSDLAVANGHIEPDIARWQPNQHYAQPLQIFRNESGKNFRALPAEGPLAENYVGRGLATLDFDEDGDLDLVLTQNGGRARLLRNLSPPGRFLRLEARGHGAFPPYGLRLVAGPENAPLAALTLASGRSYLSASEPILHLGLGDQVLAGASLRWPGGRQQRLAAPLEGRLALREP